MRTLLPTDIFKSYLQNLTFPGYKIDLPHNAKVTIGKCNVLEPFDPDMPEKQLQVQADVFSQSLWMKVVGKGETVVNGLPLCRGQECFLEHGDLIEVIAGRHAYIVCFEPKYKRKKKKRKSELKQRRGIPNITMRKRGVYKKARGIVLKGP